MDRTRLRIAIVDDDDSVRNALRRLLAATGQDVSTFASGQAFLDALGPDIFDCALLDLNMPGFTGLDVLKEMAKRQVDLPAIVVTSYDEPRSQAQCLACGAHAYLRKPLELAPLMRAIFEATAARGL